MHKLLAFVDRPGMPGWVVFNAVTGAPTAWLPLRRLAAWWSRRRIYPSDFERPGQGW